MWNCILTVKRNWIFSQFYKTQLNLKYSDVKRNENELSWVKIFEKWVLKIIRKYLKNLWELAYLKLSCGNKVCLIFFLLFSSNSLINVENDFSN